MSSVAEQVGRSEAAVRRSSKQQKIDVAVYFAIIASLAAVLYLPYFVPQAPVASDSYLFGYNNRAGIVLVAILCSAIAIWKQGFHLKLLPPGRAAKIPHRTLAICLLVQLLVCVTMILITRPVGGFSEGNYEIDRIWLLSHGRTPYVGFEWPFGALFLYGPLWLSRLTHCGVVGGYDAFWTVASLAGVALLSATINRLDYPSPRKQSLFVLFFVVCLPFTLGMGTHYTLLRYITPFYFLLVVYSRSIRTRRIHSGKSAAMLAVFFAAALLLISPEMAIAFCFGSAVLLFPYESPRPSGAIGVSAYAMMLAGFAASFAAAWKLHVLDTLRASGGGADSFPIPLSAPTLFFLGVVLVCACALVRRWQDQSLNDNSIVLIVVSVPLIAAALGRCDPGHIGTNGVGLFLAVGLYASVSARSWRLFVVTYLTVMMALPGYVLVRYVIPRVGATAVKAAEKSVSPPAGARIDFASIYPSFSSAGADAVLEAPFGYRPNGLGSYLATDVDYGFYEGIENANTPRSVQKKIDELKMHPARQLIVPNHFETMCRVDPNFERHLITVLFFFPYTARVSHPVSVHQPLCDYVLGHYRLSDPPRPANFSYGLWSPTSSVPKDR